jgi:hypothetical protein
VIIANWRKFRVGEAVIRIEGNGAPSGDGCVERNPPEDENGVEGEERRYRK